VVTLPQPETRLRWDDPERVTTMTRRFAPAICLALPARARITYRDGRYTSPSGVIRLCEDGTRNEVVATADPNGLLRPAPT